MWTAAEIIVKVNGVYVGGMDPNRDRVLLSPYIDSGELLIEMEGYNRSKPDDERNPDSMKLKGCRQEFQGLYLATVNQDALSLFYDLQLLLDVSKSTYFNEDYRKFLNQELNNALNEIDFETLRECIGQNQESPSMEREKYEYVNEGIRAASAYIEKHIYENGDFRGSGNVALVGHSHLDIAYYWRRIHAVQKNARTVLIQMRLMDRYPDFHYTHTQAYTYELLEKYYPELFEELKEKIADGQVNPYLLTDEDGNLIQTKEIHVSEKDYNRFKKVFRKEKGVKMYLAYGYRKRHSYDADTMDVMEYKMGEHIGLLLVYELPDTVKQQRTEAQAYAAVWDIMMKLQKDLPRSFVYYGQDSLEDEGQRFDELGVFLPIHRFSERLEKSIDTADKIVHAQA